MFSRFTRLFGRAPASEDEGSFVPATFRVLIPVSGGPNAPAALGILPGLAAPEHRITLLHVRRPEARPCEALAEARRRMDGLARLDVREVVATDAVSEIVDESEAHDLLVLGAGLGDRPISGSPLLVIAERARCPAIVVRAPSRPRRNGRDGPRALVVAEGSRAGMLGLERALRWARAGSCSQHLLLGPAEPQARSSDPERRPLRVAARGSYYRVAPRPLDAREVLGEALRGSHDLVVLAVDPAALAARSTPWVDEVVSRATCPVVCVLAGGTGPETRRRRQPALASV